jgi:hypothetical protein
MFGLEGEKLKDFACRQADIMEAVSNFNEQIEKVKDDFGFHFNTADYKLVSETGAFLMYQFFP